MNHCLRFADTLANFASGWPARLRLCRQRLRLKIIACRRGDSRIIGLRVTSPVKKQPARHSATSKSPSQNNTLLVDDLGQTEMRQWHRPRAVLEWTRPVRKQLLSLDPQSIPRLARPAFTGYTPARCRTVHGCARAACLAQTVQSQPQYRSNVHPNRILRVPMAQ